MEAKWEDAKLLAAKLLASSTSRDTVIRNIAADGEDYLPAASVGDNIGRPCSVRRPQHGPAPAAAPSISSLSFKYCYCSSQEAHQI